MLKKRVLPFLALACLASLASFAAAQLPKCSLGCDMITCFFAFKGLNKTCYAYSDKSCPANQSNMLYTNPVTAPCGPSGNNIMIQAYTCPTGDCSFSCQQGTVPEQATCPDLGECAKAGNSFKQQACQS
jgi:hypothetical protein